MIGVGDLRDVLLREFFGAAIDEVTHVSGVDEENLFAPVSKLSVRSVSAHKPEGGGNLRVQEEFCREIYDAVDQVSLFDHGASNIAFTGRFGGERPFRQNDSRLPGRR